MQGTRKQGRLVLAFSAFEAEILEHALRSILRQYQMAPEQIDPKIAEVWYSTRGCVRMSAEETREWQESLHQLKSANASLLERWIRQLARPQADQRRLRLTASEADILLRVLNDHRLFTAAKYDIGEEEMNFHFLEGLRKLTPEKQFAFYEIHLLAMVMEEILRLTAPDAANWLAPE